MHSLDLPKSASPEPSRFATLGQTCTAFFRGSIVPAFTRRPEMLVFAALILLVNAPLVVGSGWASLIFQPDAVRAGDWWRLLTHPFVHVSWYHLLLDGGAFFVLYYSLLEKRTFQRLGYVFGSVAGSVVAAWWGSNVAGSLCGLSGIAHGLMAVSALELVASQPARSAEWRVGLGSFAFVVGKAAYEALSGRMFFSFLDFGLLGTPVSVSHAGGIIGGLTLMLLLRVKPFASTPPTSGTELSTV